MKLFFDTEFTGLHKDTTLISLGIISEDGKTFYAEFTDYDESQCSDWIRENVTSELLHDKPEIWEAGVADYQIYGNRTEVVQFLNDWLQQFNDIQFVSDVCHYDFVLLIDLFGTAFDLPKNISPACRDINQDIAIFRDISLKEAFDLSREVLLWEDLGTKIAGTKHNSLYDAKVIRKIYQGINS